MRSSFGVGTFVLGVALLGYSFFGFAADAAKHDCCAVASGKCAMPNCTMPDCDMTDASTAKALAAKALASCSRCESHDSTTEPATAPATQKTAAADTGSAPVVFLAETGHSHGSHAGHGDHTTPPSSTAPATSTAPAGAMVNTLCPIMEGGEIDKSVYTDYQGQRVYFCCKDCIAKFQKDPAKYLKAMKEHPEKYGMKAAADASK